MSGNCEICLKNITRERFPGVKCVSCVSVYHIKCTDISDEVLQNLKTGSANWVCPDCRTSTNNSIIDSDNIVPETNSGINNSKLNDLLTILQGMQKKLDEMTNSFNFLCQTFEDMKVNISGLNNNANCADRKLAALEEISKEHDIKINELEAHLDRPDQVVNQRNILICGIPSNCTDIPILITKIINITGIQTAEDDLISIRQMVHNKETTSVLKSSFIVTFKSLELKNQIINSFRSKKTIYLHELGDEFFTLPSILLLHHLTKYQSRLYSAAKTIKINNKFQFLWCKDNNIYLRKTADSKVHQIYSFNDINRLNNITQQSLTPVTGSSASQSMDDTSLNTA